MHTHLLLHTCAAARAQCAEAERESALAVSRLSLLAVAHTQHTHTRRGHTVCFQPGTTHKQLMLLFCGHTIITRMLFAHLY